MTLTVNVVSTLLLALMLLPKLRESATRFEILPRLSIVTSDLHAYSTLTAKSYPRILEAMNDESKTQMSRRYVHPLHSSSPEKSSTINNSSDDFPDPDTKTPNSCRSSTSASSPPP